MPELLTITGPRAFLKVTTNLSLADIQQNLQFTDTRWLVKPWQKDRPDTYLIVCEHAQDILDRFANVFLLDRMQIETITQDIAPFVEMAVAHATAFKRVLLHDAEGVPSQSEIETYVKNTLFLVFDRGHAAFRPEYYEIVTAIYTKVFAETFATAEHHPQ